MVVADDLVAECGTDSREGVADDGRAEVADVHRLGDVGRGEVDHDGARLGGPGDSAVFFGEKTLQAPGEPVVIQT